MLTTETVAILLKRKIRRLISIPCYYRLMSNIIFRDREASLYENGLLQFSPPPADGAHVFLYSDTFLVLVSPWGCNSRYHHYSLVLHPKIYATMTQMWYFIINELLLVHDEKRPLMSTCVWVFFHSLLAGISICFPWPAGSNAASSAFNTFTSAVTSIQRLRSLSVCLLLTVHCVISGSFQCDAEICKSALLVLSISDRIILKQRAACLPVCPLLLPQLIRLTEALHIWPQQLFQAFLQYHIQQNRLSVRKPVCCCQAFNKNQRWGVTKYIYYNFHVLVVWIFSFGETFHSPACQMETVFLTPRHFGWNFVVTFTVNIRT